MEKVFEGTADIYGQINFNSSSLLESQSFPLPASCMHEKTYYQ